MLRPLYFKKDTGTVLVKLKEAGAIETPDKQYKTYSRGELISFSDNSIQSEQRIEFIEYIGKEVYFEEFKAIMIEEDDEQYGFIDLNDIRGYKA